MGIGCAWMFLIPLSMVRLFSIRCSLEWSARGCISIRPRVESINVLLGANLVSIRRSRWGNAPLVRMRSFAMNVALCGTWRSWWRTWLSVVENVALVGMPLSLECAPCGECPWNNTARIREGARPSGRFIVIRSSRLDYANASGLRVVKRPKGRDPSLVGMRLVCKERGSPWNVALRGGERGARGNAALVGMRPLW